MDSVSFTLASLNPLHTELKKAFMNQVNGIGFSMVEVLSMCPVGWKVSPQESQEFIENQMIDYFPLAKFKDIE